MAFSSSARDCLYENRLFIKIGEAVTHVLVAISSEDCLRHEVSDARLFHCRDKIVLQVVLIIAVSIGCNMDEVYDCKLRRSCALSCETGGSTERLGSLLTIRKSAPGFYRLLNRDLAAECPHFQAVATLQARVNSFVTELFPNVESVL